MTEQEKFRTWLEQQGHPIRMSFTLNPDFNGPDEQVFAEINAFIQAAEMGLTRPITAEDLS